MKYGITLLATLAILSACAGNVDRNNILRYGSIDYKKYLKSTDNYKNFESIAKADYDSKYRHRYGDIFLSRSIIHHKKIVIVFSFYNKSDREVIYEFNGDGRIRNRFIHSNFD